MHSIRTYGSIAHYSKQARKRVKAAVLEGKKLDHTQALDEIAVEERCNNWIDLKNRIQAQEKATQPQPAFDPEFGLPLVPMAPPHRPDAPFCFALASAKGNETLVFQSRPELEPYSIEEMLLFHLPQALFRSSGDKDAFIGVMKGWGFRYCPDAASLHGLPLVDLSPMTWDAYDPHWYDTSMDPDGYASCWQRSAYDVTTGQPWQLSSEGCSQFYAGLNESDRRRREKHAPTVEIVVTFMMGLGYRSPEHADNCLVEIVPGGREAGGEEILRYVANEEGLRGLRLASEVHIAAWIADLMQEPRREFVERLMDWTLAEHLQDLIPASGELRRS